GTRARRGRGFCFGSGGFRSLGLRRGGLSLGGSSFGFRRGGLGLRRLGGLRFRSGSLFGSRLGGGRLGRLAGQRGQIGQRLLVFVGHYAPTLFLRFIAATSRVSGFWPPCGCSVPL